MKKFLSLLALFALSIGCALIFSACKGGKEYSVTCEDGAHGYITVSDSRAEAGEKVILAAHPNAGYKLSHFTLDGEPLDGRSFVMPQQDVTVSASFEVVTYSVTYISGDATVDGNNPATYTVESAATQVGYSGALALVRSFRKFEGCTPTEYRKSLGKEG